MLDPSTLADASPVFQPVVIPVEADARRDSEADSNDPIENEFLAAAVELQSQLDLADTLGQASQHTVRCLLELLSASRVILVWRSRSNGTLLTLADTQMGGDDPHGLEQRLAMAAAEEVVLSGEAGIWLAQNLNNNSAHGISDPSSRGGGMMVVGQWARKTAYDKVMFSCLQTSDDDVRGCLLVANSRQSSGQRFLDAVSPLLASKLAAIERMSPSKWEANVRAVGQAVRDQSLRWAWIMGIAVLMVLFLPATYTIRTNVEVQPVQRRFVAVPLDGPLETCRVRPGDLVQSGEIIATIDPRKIDYELAGLRAELKQAMQEKNRRTVEHDFAASQLADLETQRLKLQTEWFEQQKRHLEIRSPMDGMIVSGDWRQSEGMPLSRGEMLFEIAPLSQMIFEVLVPEDDIRFVRTGMTVSLSTHASPERQWSGQIGHIHPAAELRDHDNVFVAEVRVQNDDDVLQPGMRGKATIYSDKHAIGWNLFHKPWFALRTLLGL